jgi:glycosyltransferase involved in cell wall biosynthesis
MSTFDYSVVMPCLNEELTIGACITEALAGAKRVGLTAEVVIADNGSTDKSVEIATNLGARVVEVPIRGYGAALNAGIKAASTNFVVMGDCDLSYDFTEAPRLVSLLRDQNFDIVIGNRFTGGIADGAMPPLHKYLGNPVLSFIGRLFFKIPIKDFHCGLRAVCKDSYLKAAPVTTGMEFATEMIARFVNIGAKFAETPVHLRKDGRNRKPHLKSFPDGWRHLKMMLLFSPQYFQLLPGVILSGIGALGLILYALTGEINLIFAQGSIQASIFALVILTVGLQLITASFITMAYAKSKQIPRFNPWERIERTITSKTFGSVSALFMTIGFLGLALIGGHWFSLNFPAVDPSIETRRTLPLVGLLVTGMQGVLCSIQVRQILSKFW